MLSATISTLTIAQVNAEDVGNYTCQATNAVGSDNYSAQLLVTGQCSGMRRKVRDSLYCTKSVKI